MRRPLIQVSAVVLLSCAAPARDASRVTPSESSSGPPTPSALVSDPAEYTIEHISEAAGEAIFTRTGVGDPYRTGIPYPIFLALLSAYPDELGATTAAFGARFGFTPRPASSDGDDRDARESLPLGMHLTTDPNTGVPFVVTNCALCHSEMVRWPGGERWVLGIGSKRLRIHAYDDALARIAQRSDFDVAHLAPLSTQAARSRRIDWPGAYREALVDATVRALRARVPERAKFLEQVHSALPGRVAAVESFAVAFGAQLGRQVPLAPEIGWAKIPDVIGFPVRRTLSWDGVSEGSLDALLVDADLANGARISWMWSHPWQGPSLAAFLRHLPRELHFPAPVDAALARRGKVGFERACAKCHGTYEDDGRVKSYVEKIVPLDYLETDPARAAAVTDAFLAAANDPKLDGGAHLVRTRRTLGYVPPVLTSIWARAPYGHAGQWSSLAVLATKPTSRPTRVVVHAAAPLDLVRVGVATSGPETKLGDGDYLLDGAAPGFHVGGHPFLADLGPDEARAVIEYLKTL
jgi:hypothetical protein